MKGIISPEASWNMTAETVQGVGRSHIRFLEQILGLPEDLLAHFITTFVKEDCPCLIDSFSSV